MWENNVFGVNWNYVIYNCFLLVEKGVYDQLVYDSYVFVVFEEFNFKKI